MISTLTLILGVIFGVIGLGSFVYDKKGAYNQNKKPTLKNLII
jgi:hypothetical protein